MNRTCPRVIALVFLLAVVAFLYAAFVAANVLQWVAIGAALFALAFAFKALCCPCVKPPG